jgi:DNA modification methylase
VIDLRNCSAQELLSPDSNILADGSVDLVITDPPYIIAQKTGFSTGGNEGKFGSVDYDFGAWDRGVAGAFTMEDLGRIVQALPRVLRPGALAIIWFDLWKISTLVEMMLSAGFQAVTMIEWAKSNPVPINSRKNYLSNAREVAVTGYVPGASPILHRNLAPYECATGHFRFPIENRKGRFHPTEKSVPLFELLVRLHSNPGDLVLDCFSGSGTTAAVCQATARRFIGSELDPVYYLKSLERLAAPATTAAVKSQRKNSS